MPDLKAALTEALRAHKPKLFADDDQFAVLADVLLALPGVAVVDAGDLEKLRSEMATHRRLSGQANYLLARIVAAANLGAIEGKDGFIESYSLPVGPIHKAIPFLNEQGITVTEDGQIKNGTDAAAVLSEGETR